MLLIPHVNICPNADSVAFIAILNCAICQFATSYCSLLAFPPLQQTKLKQDRTGGACRELTVTFLFTLLCCVICLAKGTKSYTSKAKTTTSAPIRKKRFTGAAKWRWIRSDHVLISGDTINKGMPSMYAHAGTNGAVGVNACGLSSYKGSA